MIRRFYTATLALADTRYALWALFVVAFAESSIFPLPPDLLMIPMILARPSRAFVIAGVALLGSVLGGIAGYFIGSIFFDAIGQPILEFYGKEGALDSFLDRYNAYGAWAVLIAGLTPFPYKIITILSGMSGLNFTVFIISSIVARGLRFFIVAALLWKFGAPIRDFIERRLGLLFIAFCIILLGGFYAVKFL